MKTFSFFIITILISLLNFSSAYSQVSLEWASYYNWTGYSLGQEIAILVDHIQEPATYEVEFHGLDYPSGVYFYKLITGDFSETKKLILIK